jgi:disulfide bond formation protein DsbB
MIGSLFFSEYLKYPPCSLCWWQRIFMYPLAFLFLTALVSEDKNVFKYALPLNIIGWLFSSYHNLIYFKIIEPTILPCTSGISCTDNQLNYFGFLTIPLMAFIAFSLLLIIQLFHRYKGESHV